jgi:membrane protein implicated in regulation of membrane protease activity
LADWLIWVLVAAALAAGEVMTLAFILGPLAIAAALTALVALTGASAELQVAAFTVDSIASLVIVRPVARRHLHTPPRIRTGTDALVGSSAVVLERVHPGGGRVRIGGEVWTARPYDEDSVLEEGARVEVLKIEGATALVSP